MRSLRYYIFQVKGPTMTVTLQRTLSLVTLITCVTNVHGLRHIIFIVADDLGWNDVGFHNPDMITPNIDRLASKGVILNSSYVQPVCTPSRHAFMTGTYPFRYGLQRGVILPPIPKCSPLDLKFFPQKLQSLGYRTHAIGKWHLGSCNYSCTPTFRGFDTFLGYYNGQEDYYTKQVLGGIDFNDGVLPISNDEYSAVVYGKRVTDIIRTHDKSKPLFMYLPFQSVHAPIQVPKQYEEMYPNIKNDNRRQYCGMVTAMDEAIGNITDVLEETGLMEDTLIIFTADNGGLPAAGGNNYPLRGAKSTIFEGGTRAVAFVYGSGLKRTEYTYDGLIHAVDWNPTIIAAAGGSSTTPSSIDGINQWDAIRTGGQSQRSELVYNLDDMLLAPQGHAAIRVGDFKLIEGYPGPLPDWYKPDEIDSSDDLHDLSSDHSDENKYYEKQTERHIKHKGFVEWKGDGLYNLRKDPTEHFDVSNDYPDVVKQLKEKLDNYRKGLVKPKNIPPDPKSRPALHGGHWVPGWC